MVKLAGDLTSRGVSSAGLPGLCAVVTGMCAAATVEAELREMIASKLCTERHAWPEPGACVGTLLKTVGV